MSEHPQPVYLFATELLYRGRTPFLLFLSAGRSFTASFCFCRNVDLLSRVAASICAICCDVWYPVVVFMSVNSQKLLRSPRKPTRKISKIPFKVLDAPELQDDFYLNLVDWSSLNVLSVGLGTCVYLWSACTSQVNAEQ